MLAARATAWAERANGGEAEHVEGGPVRVIRSIAIVWPLLFTGWAACQPSPDPAQSALTARAKEINDADVAEVSAFGVGGGLVSWRVDYFRDKVLEKLDAESFHKGESESARLLAWSRRLNSQCLMATQKAWDASGVTGRSIETEVSSDFCELVRHPQYRLGTEVMRFCGSRATYIMNPPEGTPSSDPVTAAGTGVEVEIRPDRLVWKPGESIKGKFVLKSASRTFTVRYIELPTVTVLDASGKEPPRFPARIFICGTPAASAPPVVISPKNPYESSFEIMTDPLEVRSGFRLDEGRYELTFPDLGERLNIPTSVGRVPIEVRSAGGPRLGKRITSVSVGLTSLTVLREDGSLEGHDLEAGARTGWAKVENYALPSVADGDQRLSPDGNVFVRLVPSNGNGPTHLDVHGITAHGGTLRSVELDWLSDYHSAWIRGFTPDGSGVLVQSDTKAFRYALADLARTASNESTQCETVPGGYTITQDNGSVLVRAPGAAEPLRIEPPVRLDSCVRLLGTKGLYLGESPFGDRKGTGGVLYVSYDGATKLLLPSKATIPAAESPDGTLVALRARSDFDLRWNHASDELEVWDVRAGKKLFELKDAKVRQPHFAGSVLVCNLVAIGASDASWYEDQVEVRDPRTGALLRTLPLSDAR
jgi:hypothetical protein